MRGLRSRLLLTLGSVLLAAISVGAAVVGPMYQSGAAASYLVTKLQSEPGFLTGMVFDYEPGSSVTKTETLAAARTAANAKLNDTFAPTTLALWSDRFKGFPRGGEISMMSARGSCEHVALVGRCPTKVGEALILAHDSAYAHLKVGDTVKLRHFPGRVTIVGTYTPRAVDEGYWFNLRDLESVPPQPPSGNGPPTAYHPAPLIVAQPTFAKVPAGHWLVR